jgi:transposase
MLHAGLDLSRHRLDVCLLDMQGSTVQVTTAPPDADGLRGLARQTAVHGQPVRAAIESMNGARFVHDQLELAGWQVAIADAQKVKGLAPLACKTDRIDAWVLAELSRRDLVPEIWLPTPGVRAERERARFRLHLVRHRTALKNRIHATLLPSASRVRSATCSAPAAASCWPAWHCPSRGSATSPRPWPSSTTWTTRSTPANSSCGTSAPITPMCRC